MADYIRRDIVLNIINTVNDTGGFAGYADYCVLFDEIDTMPAADVLPVRLILQIVQGRLNGVNYTMSEAIKSNDTDTAYKMKGANDICNEILADLKALTAKNGDT